MQLNEYQEKALLTAIYPNKGQNIIYPVLGLNGEAGEVAEVLKKAIRDNGGVIDATVQRALKKELGDVMWYIAAICFEAGLTLEDVAEANLAKLRSRQERGVLRGSGNER